MWWDLKFPLVISSDLVSLVFIQNANDSCNGYHGSSHMCYLCCLLVYQLFCIVAFLFSPIVKWCNGEMITDGTSIMVGQFCCSYFVISNLHIGVVFSPWGMFRGIVPGTVTWEISLLRTTLGAQMVLVDLLR